MEPNSTSPVREFVLRRITEGLSLGGHDFSGNAWFLILGVILTIGVVYVVWMYVRDGHSIGWFWGTFLALLRLSVYGVLAFVFLLPAYQNWEETRQQSKVVVAFDVSGSMGKQDDPVQEGIDPKARPTRQEKVLAFLGEPSAADGFFKRLEKNNPVTTYRWGAGVDEDYLIVGGDGLAWDRKTWEDNQHQTDSTKRAPGQPFTREALVEFLQPDLKREAPDGSSDEEKKEFEKRKEKLVRLIRSTNVGESALTVLSKEINNMAQGLVIFSDCRSTEGGPQAFKDLADRARRAKIPVFVVVVGEDRPETRIDIVDARGPDKTRPEDPFPVSVDVTGVGLAGHDVTVYLDVFRPGQDPKKDQPLRTIEKRAPFKGSELPRAQVEFPITPADFGEIPAETPMEDKPEAKPGDKPGAKPKPEEKPTKPEFAVGEWKFVPRVPRDPAETFGDKFHARKDPVTVRVEKRPLRVLLFASAPTRDYQFIRTMFVREFDKKRMELAIYLQPLPQQNRRTGIVQDVPPDRMLTRFPDKLDAQKNSEEALYNLANYDVIVAFDPDWTELSKEQIELVERWVNQQGGGLVVVAGPIHTLELARPGASGVRAGPADSAKLKPILDIYPVVLKDVRLEKDRNTAIPAALAFPNATPEMEFLKLDEENEKGGLLDAWKEFFRGKPGENAGDRTLRGFYGFYPVQKAKDTAITVATFKDDTAVDKSEPPYLVIAPNQGRGRVVWLGSGETWRLRQYREVWHERLWTKLVRYASAGSMGQSSRRIVPFIGDRYAANSIAAFEGQFFGKDLKPLPPEARPRPKVVLRLPTGVTDIPTDYEMTPKPVPPGGEWEGYFVARVLLKTPGKYGVDLSLQEAGEAPSSQTTDVFETNPEETNTRPDLAAAYEMASEADDVLARVDDPQKKSQLRQALQRFKPAAKAGDKTAAPAAGPDREKLRLVFDLRSAAMIPDCMQKRENTQQSRGKVEDVWDDGWTIQPATTPNGKPLKFSYILAAVVGLLCIEWLTRKLLRLA